jgi:mTERF domain-containing protein
LEPRIKFLVEEMGRDMGEVVDYPQFFRHGLKRSLEYRHKVLKQNNSSCSLSEMLDCNQKKFAMKFGLIAAV